MNNNLKLGQIVRSKAGRDKDTYFVIVGLPTDKKNMLYLSDGDTRKINKPKLKKIIHIAKTNTVEPILSDKLSKGMQVTDSDIRTALARFTKN